MSGVLGKILAQKRIEIEALRAAPARPPADPRGAVVVERLRRRGGAFRLLTEIKRRSPSAGALSTALSVGDRARIYATNGATMISVLADETFFDGSWASVAEARRAVDDVLVLAKEFVLDERQIDEAAAAGADAVLLIVRCLEPARLRALVRHARGLGLEPLVEIVDEPELEAALAADAAVIGVNTRDLDTLQMDAARSARVLAAIPPACVRLHLSGVKSAADVTALAAAPLDGALIGEALMRLDDPTPLLRAMSEAAVG
jgi:indole-3-glycerol phosphate synthase